MNSRVFFGWLIFLLLVLLLVVIFSAIDSKREPRPADNRVYHTNEDNVKYFKTCVENHLFIATHAGHGREVLAGPIGECEPGNMQDLR